MRIIRNSFDTLKSLTISISCAYWNFKNLIRLIWARSILPTLIEIFNILFILSFSLLFSIVRTRKYREKKKKKNSRPEKRCVAIFFETFSAACNGGAQVARNTSKWKCEVKLAFAEGETSFHPVPTVFPISRAGSLSVITQLFVFLRGTRFGGPDRLSTLPPSRDDEEARSKTIVSSHDVLFSTFSRLSPSRFLSLTRKCLPPVRLLRRELSSWKLFRISCLTRGIQFLSIFSKNLEAPANEEYY